MKYFQIALLLLALSVVQVLQAYAQAHLTVVGGNRYDWGRIHQTDTTLTAKIGIKNAGNQQLLIHAVRPACGCTSAPIEKSALRPGETTYLNITLAVSTGAFGVMNKTVTIESNSAPTSTETVSLIADIIKPLQPSAHFIALPLMVVGKRASGSISLLNTTDKAIEITGVQAKQGMTIRCHGDRKIKSHQRLTITAETIPSQSQIGYLHSQAIISTSHPVQKIFVLNIYGDVKEAIGSIPSKSHAIK